MNDEYVIRQINETLEPNRRSTLYREGLEKPLLYFKMNSLIVNIVANN